MRNALFNFIIICTVTASAFKVPNKLEFQNLYDTKNHPFEISKVTETTILFFWASWCTYCKEALPKIAKIQNKSPNVKVFGISVDENKKNGVSASLKEYRSISKQYWVGAKFLDDLKIDFIPVIILINKHGKIDTIYQGSQSDKMTYFQKRVQYVDSKGELND